MADMVQFVVNDGLVKRCNIGEIDDIYFVVRSNRKSVWLLGMPFDRTEHIESIVSRANAQ